MHVGKRERLNVELTATKDKAAAIMLEKVSKRLRRSEEGDGKGSKGGGRTRSGTDRD